MVIFPSVFHNLPFVIDEWGYGDYGHAPNHLLILLPAEIVFLRFGNRTSRKSRLITMFEIRLAESISGSPANLKSLQVIHLVVTAEQVQFDNIVGENDSSADFWSSSSTSVETSIFFDLSSPPLPEHFPPCVLLVGI